MSQLVALVTAAADIGDILRMTPLIRAFAKLGYKVGVLIAADYPETVMLLEGAPEIRHVFYQLSICPDPKYERLSGLNQECYDVATFWQPAATRDRMADLARLKVHTQVSTHD